MIGYSFRASRRQFLNGFEIGDSRKTLRTPIVIALVVVVVVVLLSCRFVVCALVSRTDKITIFGQLDRTPLHVRTQDGLATRIIAIKQEQRKHNDDDTDYAGADALRATVNEERVKVYDPM